MSPSEAIVAAARSCIGVRFRLHGRDPDFGLDCVGLAAVAAGAGGFRGEIPGGYALRGGDAAGFIAVIDAAGLVRVVEATAGDIVLCAAGAMQFHLAVIVPGGVVHADALLRRVVERPGALPWPVLGAWRIIRRD